MSIKENEIEVTLAGKTVEHYESLGYKIPRRKLPSNGNKLLVPKGVKILVKVKDLPPKSAVKLTKVCDECDKEVPDQYYHTILRQRDKIGKDLCFKCAAINRGIKAKESVPYENTLEFLAKKNNQEYLLAEFSDKNLRRPDKIAYKSNEEFHWDCPKCKSEYNMHMQTRTVQNNNCPYCGGRRVNETNSLMTTHPEISLEWHPTLNTKSPEQVTFGTHEKSWWVCGKCDHEWETSINNRVKSGCPNCAGNIMRTTEEFINEVRNANAAFRLGRFQITGEYTGRINKVECECNIHNLLFYPLPHTLLKGGIGCPQCKTSIPVLKITEILRNKGINFELEKKFEHCKDKRRLPFDLFVDNQILIEYDGEQHFSPLENFGSSSKYAGTVKRDKIKNDFCIDNDINLVRIPFYYQNDLEIVIDNILSFFHITEEVVYTKELMDGIYVNNDSWKYEIYIAKGSTYLSKRTKRKKKEKV